MKIGPKLKYARERVKLTGLHVREKTGIGESSLSEFENGKREPSISQLNKLAKLYRRSLSFFLSEDPIPQEVVLWREQPTENAEDLEGWFLRLCEQYHNLEVWCDEQETDHLPKIDHITDVKTFANSHAEQLAKKVRDTLQLGDRPGQTLLRVLEECCHVKVFHLDFEPSGTAACTVSDTYGAAILLNSNNARWRRNHDLAHELFHLLTWYIFRSPDDDGLSKSSETEEKFASCFASNLLMPTETTRLAVNEHLKNGRVLLEDLFDVARQFDVSVESLLWRLVYLFKDRDEQTTRQDITRAKSLALLLEDRQQESPPQWPARYRALAIKALRHGNISIGRFAEYLSVNRQEAMTYIEQEIKDDEEVQVTPA